MEKRRLGRSGLRVSRLGLGTMGWGREVDAHEARDQMTAFVEAGGTLVDTAAAYADGDSERVLGSLLRDAVPREDVVVVTKAGTRPEGPDASRGRLLAQLDGSLQRLQVDTVDLWLVDAWDDATPLEETLGALDTAVASGRCRYAGVSTYVGWQVARAATWQQARPGSAPLVAAQVEYSLLTRDPEREVVPAAAAVGAGVLAASPLGQGVLTGKYRTGIPADSRGAVPGQEWWAATYLTDRARQVAEAVVTAADGLGVSPSDVALAWVRDRPGVGAAVAGARTTAQLRGLLTSEALTLPAEIRAALDDVSAPAGLRSPA